MYHFQPNKSRWTVPLGANATFIFKNKYSYVKLTFLKRKKAHGTLINETTDNGLSSGQRKLRQLWFLHISGGALPELTRPII
jgi:hypothetical protein